MIMAYEGVLGAGKTYAAVYDLVHGEAENAYVLHNIDGLNLAEINTTIIRSLAECELTEEYILSDKGMEETAEAIRNKYNKGLVIIIDDAGQWLGNREKSIDRGLSLARRRGVRVWLIFQKMEAQIHKSYQSYIAWRWRADNPFVSLPGRFSYRKIVAGEIVGRRSLPKKAGIYDAYRSAAVHFTVQGKSKLLLAGLVVGVLAIGFTVWYIAFAPKRVFAQAAPVKTAQRPVAVAKTVEKKVVEPEIYYVGVMGDRVLVRRAGVAGKLEDYRSRVRVLEADRNRVTVDTERGVETFKRNTEQLSDGGREDGKKGGSAG